MKITCLYCRKWRENNEFKKIEVGKKSKLIKTCQDEEIESDTPICNKFIPSDYFYCDNFHYWLKPMICTNRQNTHVPIWKKECNAKCRQGQLINKMCLQYDIENKLVIKRRELKVKIKRREKIIIKKRNKVFIKRRR